MKKQRGQVTIDFMFACVLVFGISTVLTTIAFALTLTEALQYIAFAGARTYFAADVDISAQEAAADKKVNSLISGANKLPFLDGAQKNNWIAINTSNGGARDYQNQYRSASETRNQFTGYRFEVSFPMMSLQLPFFGDALVGPDSRGGEFKTNIASFLMREPTYKECTSFNDAVYRALLELNPSAYKSAISRAVFPVSAFEAINDNGC